MAKKKKSTKKKVVGKKKKKVIKAKVTPMKSVILKKAVKAVKKQQQTASQSVTAPAKIAELAQWGDIAFQVTADQVLSFQKMKRSYSGQWASHNIIGKRPKLEFQGPKMDEVTMEAILDAELGVKPLDAMYRFREAAKNGKAYYLYIGGKKVAINKFYIESGTENWDRVWNKGELARATVSLTFKEYR